MKITQPLELITLNCHSCSTPYLLTFKKIIKHWNPSSLFLTKIKGIKEVVNWNLFTPLHNISTGRKYFYKAHLRGGGWVANGQSPFITRFSLTNKSELRLFLGIQKSKISLSKILRSSRWELKISQALIFWKVKGNKFSKLVSFSKLEIFLNSIKRNKRCSLVLILIYYLKLINQVHTKQLVIKCELLTVSLQLDCVQTSPVPQKNQDIFWGRGNVCTQATLQQNTFYCRIND